MFPYLYHSTDLTIGSYGVFLAIAYLVGRHVYLNNIKLRYQQPINTELLLILLLLFGVIGAKLMFALKNPEIASLTDLSSLANGSGFSSQGAILAAMIVTLIFAKANQIKLNILLDAAAPAAALAYAIARIGCFLAGDDCYGVRSELPWAMSFPEGVEPINETVHPLPLYEMFYSLAIWYFLSKYYRQKPKPYFVFFALFLSWGLCRFLVEFISTNPPKLLGMSGSQFGALLMLISAISFFIYQQLITDKKKPSK